MTADQTLRLHAALREYRTGYTGDDTHALIHITRLVKSFIADTYPLVAHLEAENADLRRQISDRNDRIRALVMATIPIGRPTTPSRPIPDPIATAPGPTLFPSPT
jgi:hypothetical protein